MSAISVVQQPVKMVHVDDPISRVKQVLDEHKLSCLPVIDDQGSCFGVITENDLMHFFAEHRNPVVEKAWEVCTHAVRAVPPDMPLAQVIHKVVEEKYHHLVVMSDGLVHGVISSIDLVAHLRDRLES